MKKFINFIILVASIAWFGILLILQIRNQLGINITPQFASFFDFAKVYGATIILGSYVFFNTIGRGVIRIIFGIGILLLLVAVSIMLINPGLLNQLLGLFSAV